MVFMPVGVLFAYSASGLGFYAFFSLLIPFTPYYIKDYIKDYIKGPETLLPGVCIKVLRESV